MPLILLFFTAPAPTLSSSNFGVSQTQSEALSKLSEVLLPSESDTSKVTAVKRLKKRSLTGSPMLYFMKYYAKHKLWQNANSDLENNDVHDYHVTKYLGNDAFDVNNDLTENLNEKIISKKVKRSAKKFEHLRLPDNPFRDISNIVKHKTVNYIENEAQVDKIKYYLEKIRSGDSLIAKNNLKNLEKSLNTISKRSIDSKKALLFNFLQRSKIQNLSVIGKGLPDKDDRKLYV